MGNFYSWKDVCRTSLRATGAELSFQSLAAGQDYGTSCPKTHEGFISS